MIPLTGKPGDRATSDAKHPHATRRLEGWTRVDGSRGRIVRMRHKQTVKKKPRYTGWETRCARVDDIIAHNDVVLCTMLLYSATNSATLRTSRYPAKPNARESENRNIQFPGNASRRASELKNSSFPLIKRKICASSRGRGTSRARARPAKREADLKIEYSSPSEIS